MYNILCKYIFIYTIYVPTPINTSLSYNHLKCLLTLVLILFDLFYFVLHFPLKLPGYRMICNTYHILLESLREVLVSSLNTNVT